MRKSRFSEEQIVAALQLVASARRSASSDAVPEPAARGARTPRGPSPSGDGTTALCYRRLHVMLKRRGWTVNRKLVLRLVRENGWLVRRKLRNKLAAVPRITTAQPSRRNEAWAMGFVSTASREGAPSAAQCYRPLHPRVPGHRGGHVDYRPARGRCPRSGGCDARQAAEHSHRQRTGVYLEGARSMGVRAGHCAAIHSPRQADREWPHRDLQSKAPGRMLEPQLVCGSRGLEGEDRTVEEGLQRGQAAQLTGMPDGDGVHQQTAGSCVKVGLNPGSRSQALATGVAPAAVPVA